MNNRWSDAARAASIAIRQHRMIAAAPGKGNVAPQAGVRAPKPMAPKPKIYAGGSATVGVIKDTRIAGNGSGAKPVVKVPYAKDTVTGNPGLHIWIPPPDDPVWNDPKFVASFKKRFAGQKSTGLVTETASTKIGNVKNSGTRNRVVIAGKRYTRVGNQLIADVAG